MKLAAAKTVICAGAIIGMAGILRHWNSVSAAQLDPVAWGATDPSWAPDGARLAFSLFGSIWQVAMQGGEARQVSSSDGYHAHPAWSPRADLIAFVSGNPPGTRLPTISGKLRIVDIGTGDEREIATPFPVGGTPAWSPDGTRLVCGLLVPNAGSLLHEIQVSNGSVTRIQHPVQRAPAGNWTDAAWSAKTGEIFFTAERTSAPQVWSMPAGRTPIMIQLPLTNYRPRDIVLLHSLSASPDGSGVVYSAAVVNGRGNYELYRVGRQGGQPSALTNTERDEFAPAVSPDGRFIAHVSNQLGNIDLFLMPASGGTKTHVRIAGLKFRKPFGRVRLKVLDEQGNPTPVRLHSVASDGKSYAPAGSPIHYMLFEPDRRSVGFFIGRGDDELLVPAGLLRITAVKGIEYRLADRVIDVSPDETLTATIQMERWTNWTQRGWYTGENHFHANYNGSYYRTRQDTLRWLQAEDLNAANMVAANSQGAFIHDKEFFRGEVDPISTPRYVLFWGQEYRNSDPLGHMVFLNIKSLVPPSFTSVIGSNSPYDFPLNTAAALEARRQGGFVSYAHAMRPNALNDVFDTNYGAKEAPLTAALGGLDAIDVLREAGNAYELWYRLLNSGFRILPGAGTDVFTNWRGINNAPGGAREYVHVGSTMDWNRWLARYREGRVFVTNGPLLDFRVNGLPLGSVIRVPAGQAYAAQLTAEVTSRAPLSTLQFLENGQVIASRAFGPNGTSIHAEHNVTVSKSSWYAVRVTGPPARGIVGGVPSAHSVPNAHSAATFVETASKPVLVREDLELMVRWLNRLWASLEERDNFGSAENRAQARKMFEEGLRHYDAKLRQAP